MQIRLVETKYFLKFDKQHQTMSMSTGGVIGDCFVFGQCAYSCWPKYQLRTTLFWVITQQVVVITTTTTHCVITHKSEVLSYITVEAWNHSKCQLFFISYLLHHEGKCRYSRPLVIWTVCGEGWSRLPRNLDERGECHGIIGNIQKIISHCLTEIP